MDAFESVIDLLECPYNASHKLLSHTMARHVSRCRRAYGILKLVQCPFNPEHQVPELEMTLHQLECEDREAFEQYKFCFTTLSSPTKPGTPPRKTASVTRRTKDTIDLNGNTPKPNVTTRRRTLCGVPTTPVSPMEPIHSFPRVYDLRTSCRSTRKDSSPGGSPSVDKKTPVATILPLPTTPNMPALVRPAGTVGKENAANKTPTQRKFRMPMKISERKLSIDDFRQRWKQVHNERRAQSRSRDRIARRSCFS